MSDGGERPAAHQIALDLPPSPPRLTRDSLVLGDSNKSAFTMAESWAASAERVLVICGPEGSGKSHLACVILDLLRGETAVLIDRADKESSDAILNAIEFALSGGSRAIVVGRGEPEKWAGGLADLKTRLTAAPRITTSEPDEALLKAVTAKLFRDRQLRVAPAVIDYAVARLPKTFAAAQAFVGALDAASIENGRSIGLKLAREVVANLSEEPPEA